MIAMAYHFSGKTVRFGLENEEYDQQKWIPLCFSGKGASAGCAGKESLQTAIMGMVNRGGARQRAVQERRDKWVQQE